MTDFAERIDDSKLQDKLRSALNRPKPFKNFKWQIDNSGVFRQQWFDFKRKSILHYDKEKKVFRQQWFDFKKMRYIHWVKEQIDLNKRVFNE